MTNASLSAGPCKPVLCACARRRLGRLLRAPLSCLQCCCFCSGREHGTRALSLSVSPSLSLSPPAGQTRHPSVCLFCLFVSPYPSAVTCLLTLSAPDRRHDSGSVRAAVASPAGFAGECFCYRYSSDLRREMTSKTRRICFSWWH